VPLALARSVYLSLTEPQTPRGTQCPSSPRARQQGCHNPPLEGAPEQDRRGAESTRHPPFCTRFACHVTSKALGTRHTFLPPRDVRDHGGRRPAGPYGQTSCSWWCCCWIGVIGTFERLHSATNVERLADCVCVCVYELVCVCVELKFSVCDLPSSSALHTLWWMQHAQEHMRPIASPWA
jgi:hypothetical protein